MIRIEFKGPQGSGKTTFRRLFETLLKDIGVEYTDTRSDRIGEYDALMVSTHQRILERVRSITDNWGWAPIENAPRDGTYIDVLRDSIRFVNCHFDKKRGLFVREHGYPAVTTILNPQPTHWMHRPSGISDPYTGGFTGKHHDA